MNRKGFTLIELLIVVVIIGILAAIAIPKFANTKEKAYIASMKSDLRNFVTAEEAYFADSLKYTGSSSCTPTPGSATFYWLVQLYADSRFRDVLHDDGQLSWDAHRYQRRLDGQRHQPKHDKDVLGLHR